MKAIVIAAAAAAFALPAAPALAGEASSEGETKLAKMLEGREAGEARSCIRLLPNDRLTVIDGTALVYRSGGTLWVNRTSDPDSIDDNDTFVRRTFGSGTRLCRTDIVTTIDRFAGFYTGNVFLSDFVPYRRTDG